MGSWNMLWYAVDSEACYSRMGVYTAPNNAMSIFSYTVNAIQYSKTCISDHLDKKNNLLYSRLVRYNSQDSDSL